MGRLRRAPGRGGHDPPVPRSATVAADTRTRALRHRAREPDRTQGRGRAVRHASRIHARGRRRREAGTLVTATVLPGVRTREARAVAAGMIAIAAVYPALPGHPSIACPLRAMTGIPCPFCGMTRAVVAAVHGHLG